MDLLRDNDGLIDVRKLIAAYSIDEHRARADAYFASHTERSVLMRKPFQSVGEAAQIMQGLSILLKELRLFPGARVLDFGAGTAWLSRILAYLNCEALAVDLSRSALELGRKAAARDVFADELKIAYLPYDGVRLPIDDEHVERVCCFDAFHHVADQHGTLREFFRVLKPGGIAAFHEPGPFHSQSPDAQHEMANYGVIENDIFIEEIAAGARQIGFADIKVAWYTPTPLMVDVSTFNKLISGEASPDDDRLIVARAGSELQHMRLFFLYKTGAEVADSRIYEGLRAELAVKVQAREGENLLGSITARNTGTRLWLPSGNATGCVRIGVQVHDGRGNVVARDHSRIHLSNSPVQPGESRSVSFRVRLPRLEHYKLLFDLVSEQIAWFAQVGSTPVIIDSRELPA